MISAARRMLVIASEDIGLAYPQCAAIVKACVDSAFQLGLPEARIPLAQAAIVMATAPKVQQCLHGDRRGARRHSRRQKRRHPGAYQGRALRRRGEARTRTTYQYPHSYPNHWVEQDYLPAELSGAKYYEFGLPNKTEQTAKTYWDRVKSRK